MFILASANAFNLDQSVVLSSGKELKSKMKIYFQFTRKTHIHSDKIVQHNSRDLVHWSVSRDVLFTVS